MPVPRVVITNAKEQIDSLGKKRNKFLKAIYSLHTRKFGDLYALARDELEASIKRPQETGVRAGADPSKKRMTGRFTIGSGQALQGRRVHDVKNHLFGMDFPDVDHADAKTHGIWRVLEWGLGDKKDVNDLASSGEHLLPSVFHFTGDDVFVPDIGPAVVPGYGIPAKLFITAAWNEISRDLETAYAREFFRALQD